jgi:hypothetical protein
MIANIKRYAMRRINLKPVAQQTAVEWLIKRLVIKEDGKYHVELPYGNIDVTPIIEQAKQMEKEQIIEAACYDPFLGNLPKTEGEHYYKKTYKKQ